MRAEKSDSIKTTIQQLISQRSREISNENPLLSDKDAFGQAAIEIKEFIENLIYRNSKRR